MTYRQLINKLIDLTPEQLDQRAVFCEPYDEPAIHVIDTVAVAERDEMFGDNFPCHKGMVVLW